jgi:hypothetical protein
MTWRKEETRGEFFLQKSKQKASQKKSKDGCAVALTLSLQYV